MIRAIVGVILIIIACLAHSSLHSEDRLLLWRYRRLIGFLVAGFILLSLEGLSGIIIYFGYDLFYHAIVFYIPLPIWAILMNVEILRILPLKLRREGFEAVVYAMVLNLFMVHVHISLIQDLIVFGAVIITASCLWLALLLMKYYKDISTLAELIDITDSAKAFTFASILLGFASVVLDLGLPNKNAFLILPGVAYIGSFILALREIYVKYLKPLSDVHIG